MKRKINKLAVYLTTTALLLSCGNKTAKTEASNDSIPKDTVNIVKETPVEEKEEEGFILTAKGLKGIQLGMSFKSLPAKIEGLYTKLEEISNDDFEGYELYNNNENPIIMLEGDGKIERITIINGDIKTAQGIYVGMPLKELKKVKGLKKIAIDPEADYQQEQYEIDGITIVIDSDINKGDAVSQMIAGI